MSTQMLWAERALTPRGVLADVSLTLEAGRIVAVEPGRRGEPTGPGLLAPGFIDLQVNGGGGALFNDDPSVAAIETIAIAHRRFGTTGLLPTLISDDLEKVDAAIAAVEAAIRAGVPGVLGVHLEGPFLAPARKGVHDAAKFRRLTADLAPRLTALRGGVTLITLAPEAAEADAIAALKAAGAVVALGHSDSSYEAATAALADGADGFTHLFNAMSQIGSRAPGMVGAALDSQSAWASLIADGRHVHPAALRLAYRLLGPERFVLVSDAMPSVGLVDPAPFQLFGQTVMVDGLSCVTPEGVLAGANLDMLSAVTVAAWALGLTIEQAIPLAAAAPAAAIGQQGLRGVVAPGAAADLVLLRDGAVVRAWVGGKPEL
jgi:N-acetylglucosamine-6-phosphate deacetylase